MTTRPETIHPNSRDTSIFAPQVYRGKAEEEAEDTSMHALRNELRNEVRALRALVTRSQAAGQPRELTLELAAIRAALDELTQAPVKRDRVATWLRARGIQGAAAQRITNLTKGANEDDMMRRLRDAIATFVKTEPWESGRDRRRVLTLVGPTGVGKTTTAAKLAARERVAGRSVALVSCDSFRVGAIDQLERYADLLGASFHVARSGAALAALLDELREDIVFVDTSGGPPGSGGPEATVAARRGKSTAIEMTTLLCVAASTRPADATRIVTTFGPAAPTGLCVTKLDETNAPSALVHLPWAAKKPLAILCHGPRVPEDITPATFDDVFGRLNGEKDGATT